MESTTFRNVSSTEAIVAGTALIKSTVASITTKMKKTVFAKSMDLNTRNAVIKHFINKVTFVFKLFLIDCPDLGKYNDG